MPPLAALLLSACAGLSAADDAPFALGGRALWRVDASSTAQLGQGVLLIPEDDLACEDFEGDALDLLGSGLDGRGLALLVQLFDLEGTADSFSGLYAPDDELRHLTALTWDEGFTHVTEDPAGATWLRLDDATSNTLIASFHTRWWWGELEAEPCP